MNFTPYTDCGWVAYVADENITYQFIDSAWVASTATTSFAGRVKLADQTAQEAGTATDQAVTPSTQQFHPSAEKWWLKATVCRRRPVGDGVLQQHLDHRQQPRRYRSNHRD